MSMYPPICQSHDILYVYFPPLKPAFCRGWWSKMGFHETQLAHVVLWNVASWTKDFSPPWKQEKHLAVVFSIHLCGSLSSSRLFPITPHPPPNLTLACLSGLLPCIPPLSVWPPSQEVAQLVDKHHGEDVEQEVGFWGGRCGWVGVSVWRWGLQLGLGPMTAEGFCYTKMNALSCLASLVLIRVILYILGKVQA